MSLHSPFLIMSFSPQEDAHLSEPAITDHYLLYKLNDRIKGFIWETLSFEDISSRNSALVIV